MTLSTHSYRARGETICVAVGEFTLGSILVAATDKGICSIQVGDDPQDLLCDLQERLPHAEILADDRALETHVASVVAFAEQPERAIDLPRDIRGTGVCCTSG